jgi:3-O-methylgallate 3,4-dioxygenase
MLTAELHDWEHNFGPRDQTRPHVDLDGNPATYDSLLAHAPKDALARIAPAALARRHADTRAAMARLRQNISDARLDALIIVGDDQEELFDDTNMPAIGIWHGETIRNARRQHIENPDWLARARMHFLEPEQDAHYPCHQPLALHLIAALGEANFDISAMRAAPEGKYEGHAYSYVHRILMDKNPVPVVPLFLNAYYPPNQPTPARCFALGEALRQAVEQFPGDLRIGIMASGGLSHFVVDEPHDRAIIAAFERQDFAAIRAIPLKKLQSGSSEIRNWICLAGAVQDFFLDWITYAPGYRSPALTGTGLCFAHWRK